MKRPTPLWRLLRLAAPFKSLVALSALLGFATVGSGVGLMGASAFIISAAALHPSIADLQVAIVGVRFFGLARGVFRYLERYVSHQVTFRLLANLRVWFYNALEPLAPAGLFDLHSGDLTSRILQDISSLEDFYVRSIAPPVTAALVALAVGSFLYSFDSRLSLVWLAFAALAGAGLPAGMHWLSRTSVRQVVRVRSRLSVALVDGIQGMPDLLAFNKGERQVEKVVQLGRELRTAQRQMAQFSALQDGLLSLLTNLGMAAVLLVGAWLVRQGQVEGVYLAVLVLAALAGFEAVQPLPAAAQHLEGHLEVARRLFEVADQPPVVKDPVSPLPAPAHAGLEVRDLCFTYSVIADEEKNHEEARKPGMESSFLASWLPHHHFLLDQISFSLPEGKHLGLVGPSGAGKTTLVNLLLRFWEYSQGQVLLDGVDLRLYNQEAVRQQIAVVAQNTHLFNATLRENLLLGNPQAGEAAVQEALRAAQLEKFVESLPQGVETWMGEQGVRISAGERQRIAIARAVLKNAPILILDEATSNLDTITERDLLECLRSLMQGRATIHISHRLAGMQWMDEILVLSHGQVIARGKHEELLAEKGMYCNMWELQHSSW